MDLSIIKNTLAIALFLLLPISNGICAKKPQATTSNTIPQTIIIKVLLDKLPKAKLQIYRYPNLRHAIFTSTLPSSTAKTRSPITLKNKKLFKKKELYLFKVTWRTPPNRRPHMPTKAIGELHAIVHSSNLSSGHVALSSYTEFIYKRFRYLLGVKKAQDYIGKSLHLFALTQINTDINNDGKVNYDDILAIESYPALIASGTRSYPRRATYNSEYIVQGYDLDFRAFESTEKVLSGNEVAASKLVKAFHIDILKVNMRNVLASKVKITELKHLRDPSILGHIKTENTAVRVYSDKKNLYFIDSKGYLFIYDLGIPLKPKLLSQISMEAYPRSINKVGNTLLIAGAHGGLILVDVSNPKAPKILSTIKLGANNGDVCDVKSYKGMLVVALRHGKYYLINIANRKKPKIISSIDMKAGNFITIAMYRNKIYLPINSDWGISVIAITKNNKFKHIKKALTKSRRITQTYVYKNYLLTSNSRNEVYIHRLNKRGFPYSKPSKVMKVIGSPLSYTVSGKRLYIVTDFYTHAYRLYNIKRPTYLGAVVNRSNNLSVSNKFAYITSWRWGIKIIPVPDK